MAVSKQAVGGVIKGKAKVRVVAPPQAKKSNPLIASLRQGVRELCAMVLDEIVYATMDTARLLNSIRGELGSREKTASKMRTAKPVGLGKLKVKS